MIPMGREMLLTRVGCPSEPFKPTVHVDGEPHIQLRQFYCRDRDLENGPSGVATMLLATGPSTGLSGRRR